MGSFGWKLWVCVVSLLGLWASPYAQEHSVLGPKVCEECHEAEFKVWKKSKHFKSYKRLHKSPKAKKIAKAVGSGSPKKNPVCTQCHYTMVSKSGKKAKARAGTSCESCHGPSSKWNDIHKEFGDKDETTESAAEKKTRLAKSAEAGMIHASMHYEIAENCMGCHGLANADVSAADLSALLAAKHPVADDYELVAYSQGEVRHRFYRPDTTKNKKLSKPELARFFVLGQAAQLVSATEAMKRGGDAEYKALQQGRIDRAKKALAGVAEAQSFLTSPSRSAALSLTKSIASKDLSGAVGPMLPKKYK